MRFDKFTLKVQEALQEAQSLATSSGHQGIDVEHLLIAFLRQPEGIVGTILSKLGANPPAMEEAVKKVLDRLPRVEGSGTSQAYITPRLNKIMDQSLSEAARLKDEYASAEHILIAMAEEKSGETAKIFKNAGITRDNIFKAMVDIRGNQRITDPNPEEKYQSLKKYAKDFNELARKGAFDPVIGRDDEIRRASSRSCRRRTKNNPVLIGEPGVGKTAIVEGLAHPRSSAATSRRGSRTNASSSRWTWAPLIAGAKYRGEFEERLKAAAQGRSPTTRGRSSSSSTSSTPSSGQGAAEGAMDASQPAQAHALARGELHCLGATTLDEYRKYIEKDAAIGAPFPGDPGAKQPSVEDTVSILRGLKRALRDPPRRTGSRTPRMVSAAVLSDRYISDRFLPDKAIDLVDEAAAQACAPRSTACPREHRRHRPAAPRCSLEIEIAGSLRKENGQDRRPRSSSTRLERGARRACKDTMESALKRPLGQREEGHQKTSSAVRESLIELARQDAGAAGRARLRNLNRAAELRHGKHPRPGQRQLAAEEQASLETATARPSGCSRRRSTRTTSPRSSPAGRTSRSRVCSCRATSRRSSWQIDANGCKQRVVGQDAAVAAVADAVLRRARAGPERPAAAHRLVHLPRPHRRRQDRARPGPRRVPLRRRDRPWCASTCPSTWRSTPSPV